MDPEGDRAEDLRISRGFVHAVFAYDVGLSIDLARCRQHVTDLTAVSYTHLTLPTILRV